MKPDDGERFNSEGTAAQPDAIDRLLDGALAQYSQVEPRAGLEERVLANLRSRPAHRPWWMWAAIPAAVAAVVLVAISIRQSNRPTPSSTIQVQSTMRTAPAVTPPNPATTAKVQPSPVTRPRPYRTVATTARLSGQVQFQPEPRLATFPASSPLSRQEELLLHLARQNPGEVLLVAKTQEAQAERIREFQQTGVMPPPPDSLVTWH